MNNHDHDTDHELDDTPDGDDSGSGVLTRDYRPDDAATLFALYCEAIRVTAAEAYSEAERETWIARGGGPAAFAERLAAKWVRVAEDADGICGFAAIEEPGKLDLLFTAPRANRRGVGGQLLQDMLFLAGAMGAKRISTRASRVSRPFFLKHGFRELGATSHVCGEQELSCFDMDAAVPPL